MYWGSAMDILNIGVGSTFIQNVEHVLSSVPVNAAYDVDGPHLEVIYAHINLDNPVVEQLFHTFPIKLLNFFQDQCPFFLKDLPLKFDLLRVLRVNLGVVTKGLLLLQNQLCRLELLLRILV
jgi:hypothetical protein